MSNKRGEVVLGVILAVATVIMASVALLQGMDEMSANPFAPDVSPITGMATGGGDGDEYGAMMDGSGTLADPYQITNCTELQEMNESLGANYTLMNDINCSDTVNWNSGAGFEPVGASGANNFTGNFDGQNHTITGLYINRPSTDYVGLFGSTGGAEIKNVNLINVNITGDSLVGGLVGGVTGGDFDNVFVTGKVRATTTTVGGFFGSFYLGNLTKCYANVSVSSQNGFAGGLVGGFNTAIINNCHVTGTVTASTIQTGGMVGRSYAGSLINNSYATVNVTGDSDIGGLVGLLQGVVQGSYATGNVSAGSGVGGLVGNNLATISNSYYNNHTGNPNVCVGSGSSSGCTLIQDNESYFYDSSNAPMSSWDFTNVWQENEDDYPTLRVFSPPPPPPACGDTITTDTTLTEDLSNCSATGLHMTADNVVLDCAGYTIEYGSGGGNNAYGVNATGRINVTIKNCIIRKNVSGGNDGYGINLYKTNSSLIYNNTIETNGGGNNYGINLYKSIYNNISLNTILTSGTVSSAVGIRADFASFNTLDSNHITTNSSGSSNDGINFGYGLGYGTGSNNITNNVITTNGGSLPNHGMHINYISDNILINNTISNCKGYGIYLQSEADNNVLINNTITNSSWSGVHADSAADSNNFSSTYSCFSNQSGGAYYDINDRDANTFSDNTCDTAINTTCHIPCTLPACGDTITEDTSLYGDVSMTGAGSCFAIGADHITLDCAGYNIDGDDTNPSNGIYSTGRDNITIKNCNVTDFQYGIDFTSTNNSLIYNNTANSNTNYGIQLSNSHHNSLINNTANSNTGMGSAGIYLQSGSNNNIITNNTADSNWDGIKLLSSSNYNNLTDNTLNSNNQGIWISSSNNNIINNTATGNTAIAIYLSAGSNNTLISNTINNNSHRGIYFSSSLNNNLTSNTIEYNNRDGIYLEASSTSNTFTNTYSCFNNQDSGSYYDINDQDANTFTNNTCDTSSGTNCYNFCGPLACGHTIIKDTTLTEDLSQTGAGNCITIGADDITLDCDGFNIDGDDTSSSYGIYARNRTNVTIKNCNVTDFFSGIFLWYTNNSFIDNNTANSNVASGIYLHTSLNNTLTRNTLSLVTGFMGPGAGINLYESSNNNFINNTAKDNLGYGIQIAFFSNNNRLTDNLLSENSWQQIRVTGSTNTLLKDQPVYGNYSLTDAGLIFEDTGEAQLRFLENITGTGDNLSKTIQIGSNLVDIDTATESEFNVSADITIYNTDSLGLAEKAPYRNGARCPGSICTELVDNDTYVFNVTQFTNYSVGEWVPACGDTITNDTTLTEDLSQTGAGTCLTIGADDITLDCDGYSLTGDGGTGRGVYVSNYDNITIKDCKVYNFDNGIDIFSSDNTLISNTANNNTNFGISISSSNNYLTSNTANNNSYVGIYLAGSNNTLVSNKANNNLDGINVDNAYYVNLTNNTVSNNTNLGIATYLITSNVFASNTISDNGLIGIIISESFHNTLISNIVKNNGIGGIRISEGTSTSQNITLTDNTLSGNSQYQVYVSGSTDIKLKDQQVYGNYSLTDAGLIFEDTGEAQLRFLEAITGSGDNLSETIQIESNLITVDSATETEFNKSANITIYGTNSLGLAEKAPYRNGARCPLSICTELVDNDTYVFNVTQFTNYSVGEWVPACGDTITSDLTLTADLSASGTCLTVGADGITIDCDGHTITGAQSGSDYGIYSSGYDNITIKNCNIENFTSDIYMTDSIGHTILNNNLSKDNGASEAGLRVSHIHNSLIKDNGMFDNYRGIDLFNSDNNTIEGNTVYYNSNDGIFLYWSDNNTLKNNIVFNNSYSGILISYSDNNTVTGGEIYYNNLVESGLGGIGLQDTAYSHVIGVYIHNNKWSGIGSFENDYPVIESNNIDSNCGGYAGISLSYAANAIVKNNNVTNGTGYGIELWTTTATVSNNNVNYNSNYGIDVVSSSSADIENGEFISNGNPSNGAGIGHGIYTDGGTVNTVNWTISQHTICRDNNILINDGNITFNGGSLELDNCIINLEGAIINLTGTLTSLEKETRVVSANTSEEFNFSAENSIITLYLSGGATTTIAVSTTVPGSSPSGLNTLKGIDISVDSSTKGSLTWAFIKIFYDESELSAANIDESSLRMYFYNTTVPEWQLEPVQGVNTADNYVWVNATHLSLFGIFGTAPAAPGGGGGRACEDLCVKGDFVCRDGSYYICKDNFDDDSCTEWGIEDCPEGEECDRKIEECIMPPCVEDWMCQKWEECKGGLQTRKCADWNNCGTDKKKPALFRNCGVDEEEEEIVEEEEITIEEEAPRVEKPVYISPWADAIPMVIKAAFVKPTFNGFVMAVVVVSAFSLVYSMAKFKFRKRRK